MESRVIEVLSLRIWALGFTSIAIGALALLALCLALSRGDRHLRFALALTSVSAICALATHGPFALLVLWEATGQHWPSEWRLVFAPLGECLVGLLWLSVMVLFEDARITPSRLAPAALLAAVSSATLLTWGPTFPNVFAWLAVAINLALAAHAFVSVVQGSRGDLVEKRRRLRRPFLLVLGLVLAVVLTTQGVEFGARVFSVADSITTPLYELLDVALAIKSLAAGGLFLEPRIALVAEQALAPRRKFDTDADATALGKLDELMTQGEVWRREGLTVGALAKEVGLPEHRLRVLINSQLGHRNFAAFINARRADAACRQLADPAYADTPISRIAYDLGFASLGPFNRAFKEAAGVTPTEWRRANLAAPTT